MSTKKKTDQQYFAEGQEAHRNGRKKIENPYTADPDAINQWDDGWDAEEEASYGNNS